MINIPKSEITIAQQQILSNPDYFRPSFILETYNKYFNNVISDPFSYDIIKPIRQALVNKTPYSVIRIGDGEANLLTHNLYPNTKNLNRYVVEMIVSMQEDNFNLSDFWISKLQQMMFSLLNSADVIGVIGLWRTQKPDPNVIAELLL